MLDRSPMIFAFPLDSARGKAVWGKKSLLEDLT